MRTACFPLRPKGPGFETRPGLGKMWKNDRPETALRCSLQWCGYMSMSKSLKKALLLPISDSPQRNDSPCCRNLAIGIGIQNFPEGMAVSVPLHAAGFSLSRSLW